MPIARVVLKGTRHYCAASAARRGDLRPGARLVLVAEVGNCHDASAVEVRLMVTDEKLGYLSRQIAPRYRQRIQSGSITDTKIVSAETVQDFDGNKQIRIEISVTYQESENNTYSTVSKFSSPRLGVDQLPSAPGVYVIINDFERRSYIGSSKNVKARVAQHFRDLESGSHANGLLQKDYATQKGEGFTARVVERLRSPEQCEAAERRAIAVSLRQNQKLYNMTEDGKGSASARFRATNDVDASEAISDRSVRARQRVSTRRDAPSILEASLGSSYTSSQPPVAPTPQPNTNIWGWWWIVGGIALLIFLLRWG